MLFRDDDQLLAQCEVQTYRSSGPGGQNVNRRETAVRLTHVPSGIVVTCQEERSQYMNKRRALERLRRRLADQARRAKPRIASGVPKAVKRRVVDEKRRLSVKKRLRRGPVGEE